MKPLGMAVVALLVLGLLAGSAGRQAMRGGDVCDGFTSARMLQDPEVAREYFGALHEDASVAAAHLDALVAELRAVHGCGDASETASRPMPRHPPATSPRLPPGHPPIDAPGMPDFSADGDRTLTI